METILIEDRKKLIIKGATRVLSSTNTQAVVELGGTNIVVSGTNIEVTKLDLENKEVCFSGSFTALKYAQKTEKTNLLKRLFK